MNDAAELQWRRLWRGLALLLAALIALLSLLPSVPGAPAFPMVDKLMHLLAYLGLAWWCLQAWPRHRTRAAVLLILYGAFLEGVQALLPARYTELADLAANAAGVAIALWLAGTPAGRVLWAVERRLRNG